MKALVLALSLFSACASTPAPKAPDFVEDDYAAALADGKAHDRPVFVDTWAAWCHSCLAMKTQTLTDARLAPLAAQYTWVSLDSERATSADFIAKFPPPAMPTLYVIDPRSEKLVARWVGSMTYEQLSELLTDARAAYDGHTTADATALLLEGDAKSAAKDDAGAIAAYQRALSESPKDWPKRGRAVGALTFLFSKNGKNAECAMLAADELPGMWRAASTTGVADTAIGGLYCAMDLPPEQGTAVVAALTTDVMRVSADARLLADDRSGAYEALVNAAEGAKNEAEKQQWAERWATFLEGEAKAAKTPAQRAAFDAHRTLAYIAAGRAADALPMLAQSERDFPADYNPPARIAYALLQLGRLDEALVAIQRAEAKVYGPRTVRVLSTKADILEKKGDQAGAIAALEAAKAAVAELPEPQRNAKVVKSLDDRIHKLGAPNTAK